MAVLLGLGVAVGGLSTAVAQRPAKPQRPPVPAYRTVLTPEELRLHNESPNSIAAREELRAANEQEAKDIKEGKVPTYTRDPSHEPDFDLDDCVQTGGAVGKIRNSKGEVVAEVGESARGLDLRACPPTP